MFLSIFVKRRPCCYYHHILYMLWPMDRLKSDPRLFGMDSTVWEVTFTTYSISVENRRLWTPWGDKMYIIDVICYWICKAPRHRSHTKCAKRQKQRCDTAHSSPVAWLRGPMCAPPPVSVWRISAKLLRTILMASSPPVTPQHFSIKYISTTLYGIYSQWCKFILILLFKLSRVRVSAWAVSVRL